MRVLTHPRVFDPPDTVDEAFSFVESLVGHPIGVVINPGRDHLRLFVEAWRTAEARGDLVAEAYLAALAVETGAVLVSSDRDFERFPGLEWRRP